jgi:hypothetical protein
MSRIEDLEQMEVLHEQAHESAKTRIAVETPDVFPLEARDANGRFILLDSLTALVTVKKLLYEWYAS